MDTLYAALYLGGLAFFMLGLHALPRPETRRRGNLCFLAGVLSFVAVLAAGLLDHRADPSVLPFMAGLAIALAAIVAVDRSARRR